MATKTKAPKPKPAPVPESEWPVSKLQDSYAVITATDARLRYRLSAAELAMLKYRSEKSPNHRKGRSPMHLYQEHHVEQIAWRKHGGPEGWKWYLNHLKEKHKESGARTRFRQPKKW
ncbi:hypothetical protein BV25DRAFT_1917278 [Artomyces pyxidatus]|uniref:Uncharacterized protein n=1 Tax=Artomyces pyxidatus TaxID=48021 RepID=A0ACB8SX01_9AGAM|nr:hypothetical protein BV25DRAFT_1917278 [Artomyces pyxidatus]